MLINVNKGNFLAIFHLMAETDNVERELCDWFLDVKRIVEAVGSEISVPRIAGKQIHRANATTDVATPEGYYRVNVATPEGYYRVNVATPEGYYHVNVATPEGYYHVNVAAPLLDHLHQEMSNRFDHENRVRNKINCLI